MSDVGVTLLRASILSLALAVAWPAGAQAPTPAPASAPAKEPAKAPANATTPANELAPASRPGIAPVAPAPEPAPVALDGKQRQQVDVALAKGGELLQSGKVDDAIRLLEDTDKKIPGDALVASLLGTAYELAGRLDEAIEWVREGAKRDFSQHQGSEWLHARILESRAALAKDPNWFAKHGVLDFDFGKDDVPVAPEILPIEQGRIKGAVQLLEQIDYQLAQRAKYVKPPDPVAGDLYASAGDLAISGAVSPLDDRKSTIRPETYYERALEYGAPHAELIRRRLAKYRADLAALPPVPEDEAAAHPPGGRFEAPAPQADDTWWYYGGAAALLIVAIVIVGLVLDRRRRRRAAETPPEPLPDVD